MDNIFRGKVQKEWANSDRNIDNILEEYSNLPFYKEFIIKAAVEFMWSEWDYKYNNLVKELSDV